MYSDRRAQANSVDYHTLGIFSIQQIDIFLIFPRKLLWHFIQNVSNGDNLHEMSNPVSNPVKNVLCWKFYPVLYKH